MRKGDGALVRGMSHGCFSPMASLALQKTPSARIAAQGSTEVDRTIEMLQRLFSPVLNHDILLNNGSGTKRLLFA